MAKPIDDFGHVARATKPIGLRVYEPTHLPDPAQCPQSLIIINARAGNTPRARLALSNGASWDPLAFADEAAGVAPPPIDVSVMVQRAVADAVANIPQATAAGMAAPPTLVSVDLAANELEKMRRELAELQAVVRGLRQAPLEAQSIVHPTVIETREEIDPVKLRRAVISLVEEMHEATTYEPGADAALFPILAKRAEAIKGTLSEARAQILDEIAAAKQ